jgi:hypothetical protein
MAMWQIVNCKNRISSYEVHRAIGIIQKSAWFLDHRIRFALSIGPGNKVFGQIEAAETYIGGKARNMHRAKRERLITGTRGYEGLDEFQHEVDHAVEYVRGEVHPNAYRSMLGPDIPVAVPRKIAPRSSSF